jgi:hypothetical protein
MINGWLLSLEYLKMEKSKIQVHPVYVNICKWSKRGIKTKMPCFLEWREKSQHNIPYVSPPAPQTKQETIQELLNNVIDNFRESSTTVCQ